MEGRQKFLGGGGGVLEAKILEVKMKKNWNFLGEWGCKTKNLPWGSMDIFWNCTFYLSQL